MKILFVGIGAVIALGIFLTGVWYIWWLVSLYTTLPSGQAGLDDFVENFSGEQERQLVTAIYNNDNKMVIKVIDSGISPDIVGKENYTPLQVAIETENLGIFQLLLDKGADPNLITPGGVGPGGLYVYRGTGDGVLRRFRGFVAAWSYQRCDSAVLRRIVHQAYRCCPRALHGPDPGTFSG